MTGLDHIAPDELDALAAEFVLGTLDQAERNAVAQIDFGRLLLNENTNQAEIAEGIGWLKRAGEAGNLEGYQYLAEYYAGNNLLPLARHYAEIVAQNGDEQLQQFANSLLLTLDGLEAHRRNAMVAPSP